MGIRGSALGLLRNGGVGRLFLMDGVGILSRLCWVRWLIRVIAYGGLVFSSGGIHNLVGRKGVRMWC